LDTFGISKLKTLGSGLDTLYRWGLGHLGAGASAVLNARSGLQSKYTARLAFKATNNIAEYEGLILGLNKAKALGVKTILVKTNS
jgi:ribonuclease HI